MRRTSFVAFIVLVLAAVTIQSPVASADLTVKVIVNPEVEGSQIPREVLSSIFLRRVGRWASGVPVQPVDQSMRSPVRAAFTSEVLSRPIESLTPYWADMIRKGVAPPPVKQSDADVISYVAHTKGAIGYVTLGTAVPDTVKTVLVTD